MATSDLNLETVRDALAEIPQEQAQSGTDPPPLDRIYIVSGHERALNPETPLVVGDRGTGKSFWSAALSGDDTRKLIARQFRRLSLDDVTVGWGFATGSGGQAFPGRRVLTRLLKSGHDAEDIWRAVVLHQLSEVSGRPALGGKWSDRVEAVSEDPEMEEDLLTTIDGELVQREQKALIVFDGLDRLAYGWPEIRKLLQGLLKVCLDFRTFRAIRLKLFMRPDMWEDRGVWAFPDASKLQHSAVKLEWRRADLYGLIWHWLGNHGKSGQMFRQWCRTEYNLRFDDVNIEGSRIHSVPRRLRNDEEVQGEILNSIASRYMGRDRRRGKTYTWVPLHLADGKGQVSPRSFMLAMRNAAAESRERDTAEALHFDAIKRGVQEASKIRRQELEEDYPWIRDVLDALPGMTVPCTEQDMKIRFRSENVVENIRPPAPEEAAKDSEAEEKVHLPPHALEDLTSGQSKEDGLIQALIEIGVINRLGDGRLNMPDLFRVAAGIGRRGGVRPVR